MLTSGTLAVHGHLTALALRVLYLTHVEHE
jgi:hypothetical protein